MTDNLPLQKDQVSGYRRPLILIALCGLIFSILAYVVLYNLETQRTEARFQNDTDGYIREVQRVSDHSFHVLSALKSLYQLGGEVDRVTFRDFSESVTEQHPGLHVLEWVPRVTADEREEFEDSAVRDGYDGFKIRELDADGDMVTAAVRNHYFPVQRVYPEPANMDAIGYNLLGGIDSREAISKALAARGRSATPMIHIEPHRHATHGVMIMEPVYLNESDSVPRGIVLALMRVEAMLGEVLELRKNTDLRIHVYDSKVPGDEAYRGENFYPELTSEHTIQLADREWRLAVHASGDYVQRQRTLLPILVLCGGLFFTAVISMYFRGLYSWSNRIAELAGQLSGSIEDKQLTQEQYESLSEQLAIILQNIPVVCYTMRPSGEFPITYISPNVLKVIGYAPMRFQDNPGFWRSCIHPDDLAAVEKMLESHWTKDSCEFTYRAKVQNGEYRWISDHLMMVRDKNNEPDHVIGMFQDITDQREAESKIVNQNIRLEEAIEGKTREMKGLMEQLIRREKLATVGQVSGSIAHELRNPLGAVKQSIFLLKRLYEKGKLNSEDKRIAEHLELIESELTESNHVISTFLDTIRMPVVAKRKTNLRAVIYQAIERSRLAPNIPVNLSLSPDPCLIWADSTQLQRVFVNMLNNASDALSGDDDPKVDISAEFIEQDEAEVCRIIMADNGCGVDESVLQNAFEPLFTTKAKGTGLGLSICRQIVVDNHGGKIKIVSPPGEGTRIIVELPLDPEAMKEPTVVE